MIVRVNGEVWRQVPGYKAYQASSYGRVRRVRPGSGAKEGAMLTPLQGSVLRLCQDHPHGRGQEIWQTTLQDVILVTFHGLPPQAASRPTFKDGDKTNFRASNLKWTESASAYRRRTATSATPTRGRKQKSVDDRIQEYMELIEILPKGAWPATTVSQLSEHLGDSLTKATIRKRLDQLVKMRKVTVHLDGIRKNGVSSKLSGRPEKGYKLAAYPMGVLLDFSELTTAALGGDEDDDS